MRNTDQVMARYAAEIDDRQGVIDRISETIDKEGRDFSDQEVAMITDQTARMGEARQKLDMLLESRKIESESTSRLAEVARLIGEKEDPRPKAVEYRSAGEYMLDYWRGGLGNEEAIARIRTYNRAASHETTADAPGLIPTPILGPVVSFIDSNRALVNQLGPRQLPGQTWSRPLVTQHTSVALQSAEKAELVSQKMTITKLNATAGTYGGYVNVSRQSVDFTMPGVMDIVINDLAAEYAIQTEAAAATAFDTASTAGVAIPTGAATAAAVQTSLWDAASKIYTATRGKGSVVAFMGPDMLPIIGPVFPAVTPFNAYSPGFEAVNFQTGFVGSISGIPLYVSSGVGTLRMLVMSTAAGEVYEDRIGSLQVVEPSVLGVQVAYAGYFTPMVISGAGIVKVVKTP